MVNSQRWHASRLLPGPACIFGINYDLTAGCLLHKFMDDTTLTEIIPSGVNSKMSAMVHDVVMWSVKNQMNNINWGKTKEMLIGTNTTGSIDDILCKGNNTIERVNTF